MKIIKINTQYRRDFWADYECENCGHIMEDSGGYDDRNFHDNVIPDMKCNECGKSRNDLGVVGEFTQTKYSANMTV
jgi:rubredoxin